MIAVVPAGFAAFFLAASPVFGPASAVFAARPAIALFSPHYKLLDFGVNCLDSFSEK